MSAPTTDPASPPADEPAAAPAPTVSHPRPTGLLRATAVVAFVGVIAAVLGFGLLLRSVSTPTQDCGTVIGFILDGRVNVFVDPADPPKGVTAAEAKANNDRPCRERVADQAKAPAIMLVSGLGIAFVAALVEVTHRSFLWRRRRRALPPPA
ncbi:hypothetical protein [Aquihabitans sp. McL0605]|uniref:hypothetical protein n=1 Tax=Aquihabitans sp. McL0605 TaxID=3415671 RepID=UPI003CF8167D